MAILNFSLKLAKTQTYFASVLSAYFLSKTCQVAYFMNKKPEKYFRSQSLISDIGISITVNTSDI